MREYISFFVSFAFLFFSDTDAIEASATDDFFFVTLLNFVIFVFLPLLPFHFLLFDKLFSGCGR